MRIIKKDKKAKLKQLGVTAKEQFDQLDRLRHVVEGNGELISLDNVALFPSKGNPRRLNRVGIWIDRPNVCRVKEFLTTVGEMELLERLRKVDPSVRSVIASRNVVARVLPDSVAQLSDNVFMFLPGALGIDSDDPSDHFAVEFLNSWEITLDAIQLCIPCLFESETVRDIFVELNPSRRPLVISTASVLHELGHHVSAVRVIPTRDSRAEGLSSLMFDTVGELMADSAASTVFDDIGDTQASRSVGLFSFLYRTLHFARREFARDPLHGLNRDNDALSGAVLWSIAERAGALVGQDGSLKLDLNRLPLVWQTMMNEAAALLGEIAKAPPEQRDEIARAWIAKFTPRDEAGSFLFSESFRRALAQCPKWEIVTQENAVAA